MSDNSRVVLERAPSDLLWRDRRWPELFQILSGKKNGSIASTCPVTGSPNSLG